MANPQPIGMLTPQMPTPFTKSQVKLPKSAITKTNAIPKPMNQPIGVRPAKTMELILSVIDPNVWPGSMTGAFSMSTSFSIYLDHENCHKRFLPLMKGEMKRELDTFQPPPNPSFIRRGNHVTHQSTFESSLISGFGLRRFAK